MKAHRLQYYLPDVPIAPTATCIDCHQTFDMYRQLDEIEGECPGDPMAEKKPKKNPPKPRFPRKGNDNLKKISSPQSGTPGIGNGGTPNVPMV